MLTKVKSYETQNCFPQTLIQNKLTFTAKNLHILPFLRHHKDFGSILKVIYQAVQLGCLKYKSTI